MTPDQLLARERITRVEVARQVAVSALNGQAKEAVAAGRQAGLTWAQIGAALGTTRQRAWRAYATGRAQRRPAGRDGVQGVLDLDGAVAP